MSHVLMFGGEKVEQKPVQRAAVDVVTLPLPADVLEVEPLENALRGDVRLDGPRVNGPEPQFGKSECEHLRNRWGGAPAVSPVPQYCPERGRFKLPIKVGQSHHTDRQIPVIRG